MLTTLDIDEDILAVAREIASGQKTTAGRVISDLVRRALTEASADQARWKNGFLVLPKRGGVVTPELVGRLAEDEP